MNNRFLHAIQDQRRKSEQVNPLIAGQLGITLNGVQTVECPDRVGFVYVQVRSSDAEIIQAFNDQVAPVFGLPVFIQWQGTRYIVAARDTLRYSNWQDNSPYLPRHASTHEFRGSAGDVVYVAPEQFLPLMPQPSGTTGARSILINDYNAMLTTGSFLYVPLQSTQDLVAWNPSTTGAVMVLVMMDALNGNLTYQVGSGSIFGNWLTGTADVLPHIPVVPDISRYLPIAAVRLVSGTSYLSWDNIYDVRPWMGVYRGTVGGAGGGGGINPQGTGTFLAIDASNGPLRGPLVIYQGFQNQINQYFDYSTLVAYLSGTNSANVAAAVEAVNWSTGFTHYGLYVDDEGSNQGLYVAGQGRMDNPLGYFSHAIDSARKGGQFLSPAVQIIRFGGGFPAVHYKGPALLINEADASHTNGPSLEIDNNSSPVALLFPMSSGSRMFPQNGDWFPASAPYFYDTRNLIPSGSPLAIWLNQGSAKAWLDPSGEFVTRGGYDTLYGTYNINGVPHTHVITGAAFSGPFPQPVFGIFGEAAGVPLGSGTILNIRGAQFTISGTTLDLFITGSAGGGSFAGVDQIGFYAERAGVPLGTGTILNIRGQNFTYTLSGTTADLFLTGSAPVFPQPVFGIFGEASGTPLGTGTILNVRGAQFTISGTTLDLFITGTAGAQGPAGPSGSPGSPGPQGPSGSPGSNGLNFVGIMGQDEGIPLGTGTVLNVVGPNISLSLSGTVLNLVHSNPTITFPAPVFGIFGENAGVPLGTGTVLNVRGQQATLSISGTTLDLFITGSGPLGPAGGDLTGTYPNPQVMWGNGTGFYGTVFAPRIHAYQHESGGIDPIPIDLLAPAIYPAGNYLDASTGSHGLMRPFSGDPTKYIGGDGLEHDLPGVQSYYLDNTGFITGTQGLLTNYPTGAQATLAQLITSTTTGTPFPQPFISQPGLVDFLPAQETRIPITAYRSAGSKIAYLYSQFYKYSSSGTETLVGTSNLTLLTSSPVEYDMGMPIQDTHFDPTERLELKFVGLEQGAGSDATITLVYDGTTSSRLEVGGTLKAAVIGTTINNFNGVFGQQQGVPLGTGSILNVNGTRLTLSLSGSVLNLTNSPDPAELIGFYAEQNGAPLGTGTVLNIRGQNVTLSLSGTTVDMFFTGTQPVFPQEVIGIYGEYNGAPLGTGTTLNVRGPMLSMSLSGTVLDLFATGVAPVYPQPVFGVMGQQAGVPLGTGTTLNFIGAGVTATLSGTVLQVNIPGGAAGGGAGFGVFGENQGAPLGTGTIMNFRGANVVATISGSTIDVFVTGSFAPTLWEVVTVTGGFTMFPNHQYLVSNPNYQVSLTMPSGGTVQRGDTIYVVGMDSGTWHIAQPSSTRIRVGLGETFQGTAGYLESAFAYDSVRLLCTLATGATANWVAIQSMGNITVN